MDLHSCHSVPLLLLLIVAEEIAFDLVARFRKNIDNHEQQRHHDEQ